MPRLVILGSASAVPDAEHQNSHMLLQGRNGAILIDCAGLPLVSLHRIGVGIEELTDVILTHFHPDHVGAFPGLLMSSWLMGRTSALRVAGLHHCLQRVEDLMTAYHWEEWAGFFPVAFHHLPEREGVLALDNEDFRITASPVRHYVPTIGLRVLVKETGFVFAYSSDTIPCPETIRLAQGADLLIHEATGDEPLGHSSAAQAGMIARQAGVGRLGLIHYPVWKASTEHLVGDAAATFEGPVFLCEDFMEIQLER
ncbi:MAG TPA: MBL fold metallo-hydrolase [Chloroflexi bacterium]|nr:MBL fold metallo-hydrolase [Chloroflexota bacterium]